MEPSIFRTSYQHNSI